MALLDPHLPLLSQYWLAALQDHAHLALPPEFACQLPSSGGTFYSNNVAESVKPYFKHNWPSLLHAAAIWLQTTGLQEKRQDEAIAATLQPTMPEPLLSTAGARLGARVPLGDPRRDQFHLVLGLAVQTLCIPATLDSPSTLLHCLKSLNRLLEAEYVQTELNCDPKLATEILHLLHRLLLTCQSHDLHVIVMQIAILVGRALQDNTKDESKHDNEDGKDYKKTPMFALLEVAACCLLRLVPDLRPRDSETVAAPSQTSDRVTSAEMTVASHSVSLLLSAMTLCSAAEMKQALPTVLHILLHTAKFAAANQPLSSLLLTSCIRVLQQLIPRLPLSHPTHGHTLSLTLRSILGSLLNNGRGGGWGGPLAKHTDSAGAHTGTLSQMDREIKLLVLTVLLCAPSPLVCPPGSQLFEAVTQLFNECLFTPDKQVLQI